MNWALAGPPWLVGKYAVILQLYDERLSASEICFDQMEIWARIFNLPLGWMNNQRGAKAMELTGDVRKMDVDSDGKASGAFLWAHVAINIHKPIKRGVLLRMSRKENAKWYESEYERLLFYYFIYGVIGHSEIECGSLVPCNEVGNSHTICLYVPRRIEGKRSRALLMQQRFLWHGCTL